MYVLENISKPFGLRHNYKLSRSSWTNMIDDLIEQTVKYTNSSTILPCQNS